MRSDRGPICRRFRHGTAGSLTLRLCEPDVRVAAHPGIKKITDGFVFFEPLDYQLRSGRAGCGLNFDAGQPKPALNHARPEMNILDPRISEIDFPAEEQTDFHVNSFRVESVAQSMKSKEQVRQREKNRWPAQD